MKNNKQNITLKLSLNSRGQVTIFIIIGIVLAIGVTSFFFISSEKPMPVSQPTAEALTVKNIIDSCLKNISEDTILNMESFGGNINKNNSLEDVQNYRLKSNSQEELENNIATIVYNKITNCIDLRTKNLSFLINVGQPNIEVSLTNTTAEIGLSMRTTVTSENNSISMEKYNYLVNTELLKLSTFATLISKPPYYDGKKYCISCIKELSNKNKIIVNFLTINGTDVALITKLNEKENTSEEFLFRI